MLNIIFNCGFVDTIESDDPALQGITINVLDLDPEGWDAEDTTIVTIGERKVRVGIVTYQVSPATVIVPAKKEG